jgi:hypothetical protein
MREQGGARVEECFQVAGDAVPPFIGFPGRCAQLRHRRIVLAIQSVEQAWHETLHAVSFKAVLQRKKRHYSLLAKNKVASYQQIYFVEEAVRLMRQINNVCAMQAMLFGI